MTTHLDLQKIQQDVTESARKVWLAGLGTVAIAEERGTSLWQEGTKMFNQLVDRGRGLEARGEKEVKKVTSTVESRVAKVGKKVGKVVDEQIGNVMNRVGVPTKHEIETLTQRVAQLTEQVDRLVPMLAEKAAPKAAKA